MKMYIANATKQVADFIYRVPETQSLRTQSIPIGGQVQLSGELDRTAIDYIIEQHTRYGLVPADEIDRTREFSGLCYSIDAPVKVPKITSLIHHNVEQLIARGRQTREESAVASNNFLENEINESGRPEVLRNFEASVVEENHDERDERPAVAEGVRVSRSAPAKRSTRR